MFVIMIFISQQSLFLSICMVMVVVMNIYAIAKEVVQISQQVQLRTSSPRIKHVLINLFSTRSRPQSGVMDERPLI